MVELIRPPPGEQSKYERWSLVYFTRPGNSVLLKPLVEKSPIIAETVVKHPEKNINTGRMVFKTRELKIGRYVNRSGGRACH